MQRYQVLCLCRGKWVQRGLFYSVLAAEQCVETCRSCGEVVKMVCRW